VSGARSAVLLTGMSGAGKSTALAELRRRGHRGVDTDDPGWLEHVPRPDGGLEPLWRVDRVRALLDGHESGHLFVAGCVVNQGLLRPRFDAVVLLTAPLEVLLERLATRTTNPFGRAPAQRAAVVADVATVEPLLRRSATFVLDTRSPLAEVVDTLERVAAGQGPGPAPRHGSLSDAVGEDRVNR